MFPPNLNVLIFFPLDRLDGQKVYMRSDYTDFWSFLEYVEDIDCLFVFFAPPQVSNPFVFTPNILHQPVAILRRSHLVRSQE